MVLEQNDDDGQRGSGVHESENREETVKDRERRPFFGIARQDLESFDDLHAFSGAFIILKKASMSSASIMPSRKNGRKNIGFSFCNPRPDDRKI